MQDALVVPGEGELSVSLGIGLGLAKGLLRVGLQKEVCLERNSLVLKT